VTGSPFFIVGCGRSGTTLLRTMLNQHSQVAIPLESLFITDYLRADPGTPAETFRRLILKEYELGEWGIPFAPEDFDGCVSAKDFIDRAHDVYARHFGKSIWGQKTPRFVRYGHLLKRHYPGAKFVNVIRDPRAVVSSLIRSNVHNSNVYFASRRWLRDVHAGLTLQEAYPEDVISIQYEVLVKSPEETLHQVCDFLGIEFEPALLAYHKKGTSEYGEYYAQIHAKLNEAPDPTRIEAWRKHLVPRQMALIESLCGETMRAFGYVAEYGDRSPGKGYVLYLKAQRLWGLGSQIVHNFITRRGYLTSFLRRKLRLSLVTDTLKNINY
jgi:hypothetical protein